MTVKRRSVTNIQNLQKKWKHHISSSHADVRRAISTKFCTVIEVVRASDIPVTETQTDTEMIDISKTHPETNTQKTFNTDNIYI